MNGHTAVAAFVLSLGSILFGQATDPAAPVTAAYAMKDLSLAGVLIVAVVYLYRKGEAQEKRIDALMDETRQFVKEQTAAVKEATDSQAAALGEVAQALNNQQAALAEVVSSQREYIVRILDQATAKREQK